MNPIFPWCPDCPLYTVCYTDSAIKFIDEDCRWGIASDYYANYVLTELVVYA